MKKLNKLICHPYVLPVIWFLYIIANLFGSLRYFYIVKLNGGEKIIRLLLSGIWKSSNIFLIFFIAIIIFWIKNLLDGKLSKKNKLSINVLGLSSILSFILSQYLINLEKNNYNNYLYSKYGLAVSDIQMLNTVSLFFILLYLAYLFYRKSSWNNKKNMFSIQRVIVLLCLAILIINTFIPFLKAKEYFSNINFSYEKQFSDFSYINELRDIVPKNQSIILPQQTWDWAVIGNLPIVRYFLFPRVLVSSEYVNNDNLKNEIKVAYFPYLDKQNSDLIWPVINIKDKTVNFKANEKVIFDQLLLVSDNNSIKIYQILFK